MAENKMEISGIRPFEWNESRESDYLWSNVNFGEAVTEVMTPLSWSVIQFTLEDWVFMPGYPTVGNIGGRPYLNISIFVTLFNGMGRSRQNLLDYLESTLYMRLPDEMQLPPLQLSRAKVLAGIFQAARIQRKQQRALRQLPAYLDSNMGWFQQIRTRIQSQTRMAGLRALWHEDMKPHLKGGVWCVLGSANHSANTTMNLQRKLTKWVGPEDAHLLIANLSDSAGTLESLGPVVGMSQLAAGEISRADYLERYGHRGPHEFELSVPRPVEDPRWIDQALENYRESPVDVAGLVQKQQENYEAAWARLKSRFPRRSKAFHRSIEASAWLGRQRERARSAYIRDRWAVRLLALRAGEITGLGEEVFFLTLDELLSLEHGSTNLPVIASRKAAYHRYRELPPYPQVIRGAFDPFTWSADPDRPTHIYDSRLSESNGSTARELAGAPGSGGRVEGIVRIIHSPTDGNQLQPGEVLVAVQTDIAWTLLFPRAAAVITDVGAPLSHAAIVARELGIPAVVGCGNATALLKNGDRVRVDGSRGTVEILAR